ncbi:hypothetical protein I4U23_003068 [Adineta vaga]|nr:hypothetical protein I4U23_003068 [Adineta vaga]
MSRFLIRRCSMSSIEEEDESMASDEATTEVTKVLSTLPSPLLLSSQELSGSSSILDWDSELSESEAEEEEEGVEKNVKNNNEEQAANRVLQNFIQSSSRSYRNFMKNENRNNSPFSIHLYDEDDSPELDAILNELRDIQVEFDETEQKQLSNTKFNMNYYPSTSIKSPSSFSTNGCVHELRTLEDQLEAALASLTLTINDCAMTQLESQAVQQQQRSSDSSACSSGLGDEIGTESYPLYSTSNIHHSNAGFTSKCTTNNTDDCDSAFSDSGSTEKVVVSNPDETMIYRSMIPLNDSLKETPKMILDSNDSVLSHSEHSSKILIRTYNDDGSTKSIFIDDLMLIRDVLLLLIHKNHREPDINYVLIEVLPDLHMERIFEDHHILTEAILMWPTISSNRLSFTKRFEKYNFFHTISSIDDLFHAPDIEGNIYLKEKSRKSWKKHFCVLRSSGLYFVPKGKSKKDLVCLAKFENVELFFGLEWKKKFKSPSDFCFALKHPLIQKKSSKYIKYMCVDTKNEFDRWIMNIRIAKFGQQLKVNYSFMEQAMSAYRLTGRFATICLTPSEIPIEQQHNSDVTIHENRTHILHNHYYALHSTTSGNNDNDDDGDEDDDDDDDDDLEEEKHNGKSPIKSASYMDELRQRLERVLNESSPQNSSSIQSPSQIKEPVRRATLIPAPPKLKPTNIQCLDSVEPFNKKVNQIKSPTITASTPLPRKQIKAYGNLSYRTIDAINYQRHQQQQPMSKSFIIPTKREEHRSTSSLSITSKSESIGLDDTDFSPPSSTFLANFNKSNKVPSTIKSKPIVMTNTTYNRSKQSPILKKPMVSFRTYTQPQSSSSTKSALSPPSTSNLQISKQTKSTNSSMPYTSLNKSKPVPPRKSSIPRPALAPQTPQRNTSTILSLRKSQISHL